MFEMAWIDELDGDSACEAVTALHHAELETDAKKLCLAVHWADLYNGDALDATGRVLPGMEQAKRLGGAGTPRVMEFACAEFATLQGMHPAAGRNLLRDALNLRHRHPRLWVAATNGRVRAWQARQIARIVDTGDLDLTLDQAGWVDAQTTPYLATLPWGGSWHSWKPRSSRPTRPPPRPAATPPPRTGSWPPAAPTNTA